VDVNLKDASARIRSQSPNSCSIAYDFTPSRIFALTCQRVFSGIFSYTTLCAKVVHTASRRERWVSAETGTDGPIGNILSDDIRCRKLARTDSMSSVLSRKKFYAAFSYVIFLRLVGEKDGFQRRQEQTDRSETF